ncbi:hypothetical protein [Amycolatopsis sp. CA-230715]|uniref:hypothetical protein n=1 Tax=Amycolatopsis sp. CA-230715 TaxID=2745196 RepID=UPI001C00FEB6|nr:hypothetical protein [Amycolatopsis sp. CA-230715]
MIGTRAVVVHLAVVWGFSLAFAVSGGWFFLLAAFLHAPVLALLALAVLLGALYLAGTLTTGGSPWTARPKPRIGWAVAVGVSGLLGAVFAGSVADAADLSLGWFSVVPLTLPFPLAAAVLGHHVRVRLGATALIGALVAFGIWFPTTRPPEDGFTRLANKDVPRDRALTTDIPGYALASAKVEGGVLKMVLTKHVFIVSLDATVEARERGPVVNDAKNHTEQRGETTVRLTVDGDFSQEELVRYARAARPATEPELRKVLPGRGERGSTVEIFGSFFGTFFR